MPASKKEASRSRSPAQACKFQSFDRFSFTNHQATLFNLVHSFRTHDASSPLADARFHRESPISQSISQSHMYSITSEHLRFHRATANMDHIDAINMSGDEGADGIGSKSTAAVQRKNLTRSGLSV
ncbi:hypothetical protein LXL04_037332 [Taraxacum kok-saghyz]